MLHPTANELFAFGSSVWVRSGLDSSSETIKNERMIVQGTVQNGVVVLESGAVLPEGLAVTVVSSSPPPPSARQRKWVKLPLVPSDQPGSVNMTSERVAELLDEEDVSA